jgi:anti-sigma regulatory factor (Ser/Thr protein kinase)
VQRPARADVVPTAGIRWFQYDVVGHHGQVGSGTLVGAEQAEELARRLRIARSVDDIAVGTFRALKEDPRVFRAGLALTVAGGRQLRFVSSDRDRQDGALAWCLIDAYEHLPLNDAIRTGQDVVVPNRQSFAEAYPALEERQGPDTRSVVALALAHREKRFGGLLLYLTQELGSSGLGAAVVGLKEEVVRALGAVQSADSSHEALPPGHQLPPDETAPALARRLLRRTLSESEVAADSVDAALLCASEIVTNVVMHTARPSVLTAEATDDTVTVQVRHVAEAPEPPIEHLGPADPMDIAGRGLALVDALATDWGVEHESGQTCWWFQVG